MLDTGWFNPTTLRRIVDQHEAGVHDHSTPLWALLMFDAFLRCSMGEQRMPAAA